MTTPIANTLSPPAHLGPVSAARDVLAKYWDGLLPVRPENLATALGLRVRMSNPFEDGLASVSGYYDANHRLIGFNGLDAPVRQRFTIAHEIGHAVLSHGDSFRDTPATFSAGNTDPKERDANQFAAELLMPADALTQIVKSGQLDSVDDFARIFQVSNVAMAYRLSNLGLI